MKFEHSVTYNFGGAFRGMRNPKNSWNLSDSAFGFCDFKNPNSYRNAMGEVADTWVKFQNSEINEDSMEYTNAFDERVNWLDHNGFIRIDPNNTLGEYVFIGPKDMRLAQALISGGSEHRKYLRQIFVSVDITAPMYVWSEFDTYKVGTVSNSTSKMHKVLSKPITFDCFETDDYEPRLQLIDPEHIGVRVDSFLNDLEQLRQLALNETDPELKKQYWKELIRWLPESWLQTRTITLNYEVVRSMVHQRQNHKLSEWRESFIAWAHTLPYADELIFYKNDPTPAN